MYRSNDKIAPKVTNKLNILTQILWMERMQTLNEYHNCNKLSSLVVPL